MDKTGLVRRENKYLLTETEAAKIRDRIGTLLLPDRYSGRDGYQVRSLYFDTPDNHDFETKLAGVENRKKIRLRIYSPDSPWVSLEEKRKSGDLGMKTSLRISREDAGQIAGGEFGALLDYAEQNEAAVRFYTGLTLGCMRPVTMIEYHRTAFVYPECNTRITFDSRIMCSETDFDLFRKDFCGTPVLTGFTVMEVKYDAYLMKFISDVLKPHRLTRLSVSKYCFGRPVYYL